MVKQFTPRLADSFPDCAGRMQTAVSNVQNFCISLLLFEHKLRIFSKMNGTSLARVIKGIKQTTDH